MMLNQPQLESITTFANKLNIHYVEHTDQQK
jgi:hypothetical protein